MVGGLSFGRTNFATDRCYLYCSLFLLTIPGFLILKACGEGTSGKIYPTTDQTTTRGNEVLPLSESLKKACILCLALHFSYSKTYPEEFSALTRRSSFSFNPEIMCLNTGARHYLDEGSQCNVSLIPRRAVVCNSYRINSSSITRP